MRCQVLESEVSKEEALSKGYSEQENTINKESTHRGILRHGEPDSPGLCVGFWFEEN